MLRSKWNTCSLLRPLRKVSLTAPLLPDEGRAVKLKTREEAAQWFADRGITITEWALERRFSPALVYQVLAGTRKAVRGSSQIAVALGMKSVPVDDFESA